MNNTYCEYDIEKANYMIKKGFKVLGCGIHSTTKNTYICFAVSKNFKEESKKYDELVNNK